MRNAELWMALVVGASGTIGCGDDGYDGDGYGDEYYSPAPSADMGAPRSDAGAPSPDAGALAEVPEESDEPPRTNPFVLTETDPFSTFASDVDTASYDIFVQNVDTYARLPNPSSVRLEEFVNYFDYDYTTPEPSSEIPFAIDLDASTHVLGRDLAQLRVGIQAAAPAEFEKLPTNLVFLVDVSGSMSSADKLPLVQHLIRETIGVLEQNDTVSIVSYASNTGVRLEPTAAFERETIEAAVAGLSASGSTDGGSGIQLAYRQAEAGFLEDGLNQVVLCTDGDFNVGITSSEALVSLIEDKRMTGVNLTALGFGGYNLNDAMMERVSNAGNGFYSVITSADHAARYAQEKLLRTTEIVAQDLKIQLELNPDHVVAYRLLGFENRAIADVDFTNDGVDAGEIGAGHRVTALYELVLTGQSIPSPEGAPEADMGELDSGLERTITADALALVRVRWKDRGASAEDPAHETMATVAADAVVDEADADTRWAAAVAAFAELLKDSPYADPADMAAVETLLLEQSARDDERTRFVNLFQRALGLMER